MIMIREKIKLLRSRRYTNLVTVCLVTALSLCVTLPSSCQNMKHRTPIRYVIPIGFTGWVKLYYKVKDAPPLKRQNGVYEVRFSDLGIAKTSSDMEIGFAEDVFIYEGTSGKEVLHQTSSGKGGLVWDGVVAINQNLRENTSVHYVRYFIGTEVQYKEALKALQD